MTIGEYMEKVSHEEHLLRVAELAIDPYRDIAKILGTLCMVSIKSRETYPHSDSQLLREHTYREAKANNHMTESDYSLLYAFVGKEQADKVLQEIRERESCLME